MSARVTRIFLTADAVGGVWTYAADLARGLAREGCAVTLAVLGPAPDAAQADAVAGAVELVVTGLPLDWTAASPDDLLRAADALAAEARRAAPEVVHLHSPALLGEAAYPAPVVANAHYCVATWWRSMRSGPLPKDLAWRAEATGRGLHRAAAVLVPSHAFGAALRAAYPGDWTPRVVPNGRAAPPEAEPGERHGVLTAGRLWDEAKNVALLDRVAAEAKFAIEAAGPVEGPNGARARLRHLNLLGRLSEVDLRARMAAASVFASPALYEPFGLGVLEAAQAGCALVLSDIPTLRELWDGAAVFVPSGAVSTWRATLSQLVADGARARTLGASARERSQRYTDRAMVSGTRAAYAEAAPG